VGTKQIIVRATVKAEEASGELLSKDEITEIAGAAPIMQRSSSVTLTNVRFWG
jgi:hypothetical protein